MRKTIPISALGLLLKKIKHGDLKEIGSKLGISGAAVSARLRRPNLSSKLAEETAIAFQEVQSDKKNPNVEHHKNKRGNKLIINGLPIKS